MQNLIDRLNSIVARAQTASTREEGQGTVEYILVAGVIAVAVVVAVQAGIGNAITAVLDDMTSAIETAL